MSIPSCSSEYTGVLNVEVVREFCVDVRTCCLMCWFSALHYAASLSGPTDVLEMLLSFGADVDVLNNEASTPLFFATQSNNQFAACVLINQGANVRQKNGHGVYYCSCSVVVTTLGMKTGDHITELRSCVKEVDLGSHPGSTQSRSTLRMPVPASVTSVFDACCLV